MRKNRGTENNKNLLNIIEEDIHVFDLKKKLALNPFFDSFEKKDSDNFLSRNLMFDNKETIWNGIIQDFSAWENIIERVGEYGYYHKKFNEEKFSNTPVVLTQSAINPENLFMQNETIIETMFETYKTPYLLITSQACLNIMSQNTLSGFVVDMGESGTQFTSVIDGFTQYHDSYYNSFLSGRNLNLFHYYEKQRNNNSDCKDYQDFDITFLKYMESKPIREEKSNELFEGDFGNFADYNDFNIYDGLYFYPKIFRNLLQKKTNPIKFKSLDKPVFLLEFLQKDHLNSNMIDYQKLLRDEMYKDFKELFDVEKKEEEKNEVKKIKDIDKSNILFIFPIIYQYIIFILIHRKINP